MMKKGQGRFSGVSALSALSVLLIFLLLPIVLCAAEGPKWTGVDEAVIEKFAAEQGREVKESLLGSLIGEDQGDILLFLFLLAGAVGGFAAGYYWRVLVTGKGREQDGEGAAMEGSLNRHPLPGKRE